MPTPSPASGEQDNTVLKRETEYSYNIMLPDGWKQEAEGRYSSASPWAHLEITSRSLPAVYNVDQFTELVQSGLWKDWWPNASLFEITSVEDSQQDHHSAKSIRYRVQESPQYCVVDVQEVVLVSQVLPGNPQGFRIKAWMCEHDVAAHGDIRNSVLDSFQVTTIPARYYTQFVPVKGVMVKGHKSVDPAALLAGAEIVDAMLSGREDIVRCMSLQGADLAVIPRDQVNTDLPEFAHLAETMDFTGRRRDTFEIRGLGGVMGQPVSSAAEEQLLGNWESQHPRYPYRGLVATHEYAHAVQNLCFTQEDWEKWNKFYDKAVEENWYPGSHMMADIYEFFAVFSTGYFEVTNELGHNPDREELWDRFPEIIRALDEIYLGATVPEKFRIYVPR